MIKAFVITKSIQADCAERAHEHIKQLAKMHATSIGRIKYCDFDISFVGNSTDYASDTVDFSLVLGCDHAEVEWDRFLKIRISCDQVVVENDYAGSIPFFFSSRNGFAASNIEPCVYLASNSSLADLSIENIYGYLRYSHFIWEETAWAHINQMLPDSRYVFSDSGKVEKTTYLETVKATDSRKALSDSQVARQLFEINEQLVTRTLSNSEEVILPLSSGYDSRMIFAVLSNNEALAKRTRCFTYGSTGSIEVEGARRLCDLKGITWGHVELPCRFLDRKYLKETADVFGASMHMHGMYQLEFVEKIRSDYGIAENTVLTSGFMTGVPAGQHNGLLDIKESTSRLTTAMNRFSQSKVWTDDTLSNLPLFNGKNYLDAAEERFRLAFNRFNGEIHQKAVIFDVWTRQRNFISYYPRTLEWRLPVVSPHMCAEYANFFMSLSKEHLWNRNAVELMFLKHYPDIARIASNSNGIAAIGNAFETGLFFVSRLLQKVGMPNPLPLRYKNLSFDFDMAAVKNSGADSFYPLLDSDAGVESFVNLFGGRGALQCIYQDALDGDTKSYAMIVAIQSIAFNYMLN